jgi:6-phosphofructokinase 1
MDRLRTTGDSHGRCMVAEVMGRHVGWIALHSGMAAGAHAILIPEQPFDIDKVCQHVENRFQKQYAPIVVVSEGAVPADGTGMTLLTGDKDEFGHVRLGGIGDRLAAEIEQRTGKESRAVVLGHVQRGGTPTAYDRVLATRYGMAAIESIRSQHWGRMVALRGTQIVHVPFEDALGRLKVVPQSRYDEAAVLFG